MMLNVAIVGFGLSGKYLQAPFFEANKNFVLDTIVTNNQDPTLIYPSVKKVTSLDEVLTNDSIDLVSICTPNDTHFEYAKKVLLANKHVLVEKPFTATVAEAEELIALAAEQKKVIAIFQNRRFDSDFLTVKKLIKDGTLGNIEDVQINYDRYKPELNVKQWKEIPSAGSGIIYDLGAHIIDQAIDLFGIPLHVEGETFVQRANSKIDDAFFIELQYDDFKVTLKSSLIVKEPTPRYIIKGSNGTFTKYGLDVQEDQLKEGLKPTDVKFAVEPTVNDGLFFRSNNATAQTVKTETGKWALLFTNLYNAITQGEQLIVKPNEVVAQIKIIQAVKQRMPS